MNNKTCSKCKTEKDITNFSKSGKYYNSWCHCCRKEDEQQRRIRKGIKERPKPSVIDENHKECLECHKIFHIRHFSESPRGRLGKSSYCKKCQKFIHRRIRHKDPAKYRAYTQRYRDTHREYWRSLHRVYQFNRRNKIKARSDGTITEEFMTNLYAKENCYWCKEYTPVEYRTAEHIIPLNKGGIHGISNLEMACLSCNCSKFNF